jgi:hypothetical protein
MRCRRWPSFSHYWRGLAMFVMLLATGCDHPPPSPPAASTPGEVRHFTGTWSATGNRQSLQFGPEHQAAIFKFTGSLLLTGPQRLTAGFKAEAIGFTDSESGMQGRSVWTDERGDKVFSELRGEAINPGKLIDGRFIGGTGRFAGVSGEYSFTWQTLVDNEDGEVSGRVVGLKGWARLGTLNTLPPATGGSQ